MSLCVIAPLLHETFQRGLRYEKAVATTIVANSYRFKQLESNYE